jgi:5S rRNA maturation endonuclease (ribonuclease M5)
MVYFDIDYVEYPNRLAFPCPVHGGDNPEACCVFTDGMTQKGNWACWTHHCEEEFANNLFGFVRGCLSERRKKSVSMNEAAAFCSNFLDKKIEDLGTDVDHQKDTNIVNVFNRKIERNDPIITREEVRSRIKIPADYYIGRGFSPETLNRFDVGACGEKNQPMSGRVVVPIYDEGYNYIGCVGRATNEQMKPKWLHSRGFKKSILYGLHLAKEEIRKTQAVILVEGQGDVWRMHEAGFQNTVGIFGSSINDDQLMLLESSGALNLVILTDSDEAGNKAFLQIVKKCGRRFNYSRPAISQKDVGDMSVEQIKEELYPQLKGMINEK